MNPPPKDSLHHRDWEYAPDTHGLVEDISDSLVCREEEQFLLTGADGDIPSGNDRGLGYYARDTRHLSAYSLLINGEKPLVLVSAGESGFGQQQVLGNHRATFRGHDVGRATVEMVRERYIADHLSEKLVITNHNPFDVGLQLSYIFEADFRDVFEIRGHERQHPGRHHEPSVEDRSIRFRYDGSDGVSRSTLVLFRRQPDAVDHRSAAFNLTLGPSESTTLELDILTNSNEAAPTEKDLSWSQSNYAVWREEFASLYTDNEHFNDVAARCIDDLRTLWTNDESDGYFAAGLPWYATLFGRDSIIAALQVLPYRPELTLPCLRILARYQGTRYDPEALEEPGKILHEKRYSELTATGELPYGSYFGSVDSTPLFLLLAAEYYRWTADAAGLRELKPNLLAALRWILEHGRRTSDPYLRYRTDSESGLRNQGWKDSSDPIIHASGDWCDGPIALVEVQAYLYAVCLRIQPVLRLWDEAELAARLDAEADRLRERITADFWLPGLKRLSMALDGDDVATTVLSSNAGHALLSGVLTPDQAEAVRDGLMSNEMFSGWGIRTLSSASNRYFPLGYHVGTIWPHDNALIAVGLKRYGFDAEVNELLTSLFQAAQVFPFKRLPELFGGHPRSPYLPPVPYPVACRPQAWAAGSLLQLLATTLGLHPDAPNRTLNVVRPTLPYWLQRVHLSGIRVGDHTANLVFERHRDQTRVDVDAPGLRVNITQELRPFQDA